jgi:hypothetical protein
VSPLRDLLIAPRPAAQAPPRPVEPAPATAAPSLGVLAAARELPAVAIAAGLAFARRRSTALVCLHAPAAAGPARLPARTAAARLTASLAARGLVAEARGAVALVRLADDPPEASAAATRALAAAGALPTVLGVAHRTQAVDVLLGGCDAILVVLSPGTDAALAGLAVAGAREITASAAALTLALDPVQRALAVAGCWSPPAIRHAIKGVLT